jgi:carotenoid cleavage dioxygenase
MEPVWLWHFVNAFEEQQQVIIDYVRHPQIRLSNRLEEILSHRSQLHRVVLDVTAHTVQTIPLDDRSVELPTIHPDRLGQSCQFAYMPHIDLDHIAAKGIPNYFPELVQYDLKYQTSRIHRLPAGCYAGEAIVVPKANGTSETDSYILSWVFDENRRASDLFILDADQFDQAPIAQVHLPVRVPFGFHGSWLPKL